ncbi:hypothetical protein [Mesorhizobium sp. LNJC384A00]|uniref:hypothetical protein n=1 Tax=Mesorhizobium sp. LNJC384A00 TaxID=1287268 RepID=UPI00040DDCD5|nr:hypothetical protein [Mesorhizobium sp. LNJC384A00]
MAISEGEARSLIETILKTLAENAVPGDRRAIDDLIAQWHAEIEAGRPVDRKLKVRISPGLDVVAEVPRSRTAATGEFVGKKDYSQIEQLDLLLEALGLAFVAPQMMASKLLETILQFARDGGAQAAAPVTVFLATLGEAEGLRQIDSVIAQEAAVRTQELANIIAELSEEKGLKRRAVRAPVELL